MPYKIIQKPKRKWEVINERTGRITANNTTLTKAKKQIRLLHAIEHNPQFLLKK